MYISFCAMAQEQLTVAEMDDLSQFLTLDQTGYNVGIPMETLQYQMLDKMTEFGQKLDQVSKDIADIKDKVGHGNTKKPPLKCFNCHKVGHFSPECPEEKQPLRCFTCKSDAHFAQDCPEKKKKQVCYSCQKEGHWAQSCPQKLKRKAGGDKKGKSKMSKKST